MDRGKEVERKFENYIEDYLLPMVIVVILGVAVTWVTFSEGSSDSFLLSLLGGILALGTPLVFIFESIFIFR